MSNNGFYDLNANGSTKKYHAVVPAGIKHRVVRLFMDAPDNTHWCEHSISVQDLVMMRMKCTLPAGHVGAHVATSYVNSLWRAGKVIKTDMEIYARWPNFIAHGTVRVKNERE